MANQFELKIGYVFIYILALALIMFGERYFGFNPWAQLPVREWTKKLKAPVFGNNSENGVHFPLIYIITPTVYRTEQKADLTRMSQTLRLVVRIHWIVIEDRATKSEKVAHLLKRCKVNFTHLAIETTHTGRLILARGHQQRNLALEWITNHGEFPSVFYFADDDNTYDIRLFKEMRFTKKVSVWPVGLVDFSKFQTPIVRNGKVVSFASGWGPDRQFPVDMAAFAVNSEILKRPNPPRFRNITRSGYLETNFVGQLNVTIGELEPRADNCTKILVWHTRTERSSIHRAERVKTVLDKYNLTELEV